MGLRRYSSNWNCILERGMTVSLSPGRSIMHKLCTKERGGCPGGHGAAGAPTLQGTAPTPPAALTAHPHHPSLPKRGSLVVSHPPPVLGAPRAQPVSPAGISTPLGWWVTHPCPPHPQHSIRLSAWGMGGIAASLWASSLKPLDGPCRGHPF